MPQLLTLNSFFVTSVSDGAIIDMCIDDSVFYSKQDIRSIRKGCTISMLSFIDRMIENIPYFISGRAALNSMDCSKAPAAAPATQAPAPAAPETTAADPAASEPPKAKGKQAES